MCKWILGLKELTHLLESAHFAKIASTTLNKLFWRCCFSAWVVYDACITKTRKVRCEKRWEKYMYLIFFSFQTKFTHWGLCPKLFNPFLLPDHAMAMNSYGVTIQINPLCENFCVVLFTSCNRTKRRLICFANYFLVQYVWKDQKS